MKFFEDTDTRDYKGNYKNIDLCSRENRENKHIEIGKGV